ncbi:MAG: transposase [Mesorhizobium sp.]|nr:MAG: transposase [Mesorhizobium sp.]
MDYANGLPLQDLPDVFGDWNSVFRRFSRWSSKGVWWLSSRRCPTIRTSNISSWIPPSCGPINVRPVLKRGV